MARFESGWIRVERRIAFGDIGDNPLCLALWVWLLSSATIQKTKIRWHGESREIGSGMVLFSIRSLAERWGVLINNLRRQLSYLASSQRIQVESGTHGTLVTICNWKQYQESYKLYGTPVEHQLNTNGTPTEHELNYIEQYTSNNKQLTKTKEGIRATSSSAATSSELWNLYLVRFQEKYKATPPRSAKVNSLLKNLLNQVGNETALKVINTFFDSPNPYYEKIKHPLDILIKDLNQLVVLSHTGIKKKKSLKELIEESEGVSSHVKL